MGAPPTPEERRQRVMAGSRRKRDFDGMAVTDEELAIAEAAVSAFNELAGSHFRVAAHRRLLFGRIFEHPELTADDHRQIVAAVFRAPWWEGRPGLRVIYKDAERFERALDAWRSSKAPAGGDEPPANDAAGERSDLVERIYSILDGGVATLPENDYGRPWPRPDRKVIAQALDRWKPEAALAEEVAKNTRLFAQRDGKAYRITNFFAQQLEKAHRADVRQQITDSLETT